MGAVRYHSPTADATHVRTKTPSSRASKDGVPRVCHHHTDISRLSQWTCPLPSCRCQASVFLLGGGGGGGKCKERYVNKQGEARLWIAGGPSFWNFLRILCILATCTSKRKEMRNSTFFIIFCLCSGLPEKSHLATFTRSPEISLSIDLRVIHI